MRDQAQIAVRQLYSQRPNTWLKVGFGGRLLSLAGIELPGPW